MALSASIRSKVDWEFPATDQKAVIDLLERFAQQQPAECSAEEVEKLQERLLKACFNHYAVLEVLSRDAFTDPYFDDFRHVKCVFQNLNITVPSQLLTPKLVETADCLDYLSTKDTRIFTPRVVTAAVSILIALAYLAKYVFESLG